MNKVRPEIELLEKNRPRQARAKRTYENILNAAAELLVEIGVERISTNLVAERAGITVPALYRYFPNKYAVLYALGASLMDRQIGVFEDWFERNAQADGNISVLLDNTYDLLQQVYDKTREQVGGYEITQTLRAVQPLQDLRLQSQRLIASRLVEVTRQAIRQQAATVDDEAMLTQARLTIGLVYGVVEMALSDDSLITNELLKQGAHLATLYWADFADRAA
ncbi:MAG: TetR/AcrR family transcriptional regulator [Parahaliea sp.]